MGDQVSEALHIIKTWKPESDVFAFKYGSLALTAASTGSAMYINSFFRRALKMKSYALATTYIASTIPAGLFTSVLHGFFVLHPLLSGKTLCPVCLETRSAITQSVVGVLYPMLLSPIACIQFAQRYLTVYVPSLTADPKQYMQWFAKTARPLRHSLLSIFAFQLLLGGAVAHLEQENVFTVAQKIKKMEEEIERKESPEYMEELKKKANAASYPMFSEPERKYPFSVE